MGDKTGISWTDATWNPVRGCSRVSAGCMNCYAERVATRFSGPGQPYEGLVTVKSRHSDNGRATTGTRGKWNGVVRLVPEHLADPLRWKKPRRIFVNSMSDLFHEGLTNEEIAAVFGVMAAASQHTFQVLTKRARRMREWFEWVRDRGVEVCSVEALCQLGVHDAFADRLAAHWRWPLPNVWLGVSVENQEAADERIPHLVDTPAAVRFLSCEPLLGPVTAFRNWHVHGVRPDWVIAGCESGPGARTCEVEWLRALRDECRSVLVPFFLKQAKNRDGAYTLVDRKQGWVAGAVGPDCIPIIGIGQGSKEKGGGVIELPYLDGFQHAEFPHA